MYKKSFEIELEVNEGNFERLNELYLECNGDNWGTFENFNEFLEEMINFRLLRHIFENAEIYKDFMRNGKCQQT